LDRILVIQTASIGDVILATALVEKLHSHYRDASIDFMLKKGNEALFEDHPFLGDIITWDKKHDKYRNLLSVIKRIRQKQYDLVVNVQRFASSGLLTTFSGAKQTAGFDKNPFSKFFTRSVPHLIDAADALHETERNQALISHLTDGVPGAVKLYPAPHHYKEAASHIGERDYVCIAPASLWFTKQFPT
jgi:heptosyltransferase-2